MGKKNDLEDVIAELKGDEVDDEIRDTLRDIKRETKKLRSGGGKKGRSLDLLTKLFEGQALDQCMGDMIDVLSDPPKKADGTPILEWPTDPADQGRVIKFLLENQRKIAKSVYNTASTVKAAGLVGLLFARGSSRLFGDSGELMPILLLSSLGGGFSLFNIFSGNRYPSDRKIWSGNFGS